MCSEEIKDWPVAYHGTPCESPKPILDAGLRKPRELSGAISLSRNLWHASHPVYSTMKWVGPERRVQAALQLRVRPGSSRRQHSTLSKRQWDQRLVTSSDSTIRPSTC